jgi:transcription initiation factor TFIID subunit 12
MDSASAAQQLIKRLVEKQKVLAAASDSNSIVSAKHLQDLLTAIDPKEKIDPAVEDMIIQIAEDFVATVATCSSLLAKHRGSHTLDVADIQLHLEKSWNIRVPGYSTPEAAKMSFRRPPGETHQRRLAAVKKSVASAQVPEAYSKKRKHQEEDA